MTKSTWIRLVSGFGLALVLGAGCASDEVTDLSPTDLTVDSVLPPREVLGTLVPDHPLKIQTVYFDYDRADIKETEVPKIQAAATYLQEHKEVRCELEGHCDERGSNEYNMALGERRAHAVRGYLMRLGVEGSRLYTKSYGEEKPVDLGHDESAWSKNRRVEFTLYK